MLASKVLVPALRSVTAFNGARKQGERFHSALGRRAPSVKSWGKDSPFSNRTFGGTPDPKAIDWRTVLCLTLITTEGDASLSVEKIGEIIFATGGKRNESAHSKSGRDAFS